MENIEIKELTYNELLDISGGHSVAYWIGYGAGVAYDFCDGFIDGLFGN